MTKVTILGQEPNEKELKKIEFKAYIMNRSLDFNIDISERDEPRLLKEIKLLPKPSINKFDLMLCVRQDNSEFYMLGHFNDGIV